MNNSSFKVDAAIKPGGTYLSWLTSQMNTYINNIRKALDDLEFVIRRVMLYLFIYLLILNHIL